MNHRPPPGQRVTLRYRGPRRKGAPSVRDYVGLHLARGVVVACGGGYRRGAMPAAWEDEHHHGTERDRRERKGSPVNVLVRLEDGRRVVVPRGQLFKEG